MPKITPIDKKAERTLDDVVAYQHHGHLWIRTQRASLSRDEEPFGVTCIPSELAMDKEAFFQQSTRDFFESLALKLNENKEDGIVLFYRGDSVILEF